MADNLAQRVVQIPNTSDPPPMQNSNHLRSSQTLPWARKKRLNLTTMVFLLVVGLPTILASGYFAFFASDMYVSKAHVMVRDLQNKGVGILGAFLGSTFASAGGQDSEIVGEFILSRQALEKLDAAVDFKKLYGSSRYNYFSRLSKNSTREEMYSFYLNQVDVEYNSDSGTTIIAVRGFAPTDAQIVLANLIEFADKLVSSLAERAQLDTIKFSRNEVEVAETRLRTLNARLMQFRVRQVDIDPKSSAKAVQGVVAKLEQQFVQTRTQLAQAKSFLQPGSIAIGGIKARLEALEQQLVIERARLAGGGSASYTRSLAAFEELNFEMELARKAYESALGSFESARQSAAQKTVYLVPFVQPSLADEASYPNRLLSVLTVFLSSLVFWGIGLIIYSSIKEHVGL